MHKAVFLDRDGVLNRGYIQNGKSYAPRKTSDFKLLPYAIDSVQKLVKAGYRVIVVTNQPDINNKLVTFETVNEMHNLLRSKTLVTDIFLCPHTREQNCSCRKPKAGMLLEAAKKYNIDLTKSFMVGDRSSDIEAGTTAGCRTIFLDRKYSEPKPVTQERTFLSLNAAANYIINQKP